MRAQIVGGESALEVRGLCR